MEAPSGGLCPRYGGLVIPAPAIVIFWASDYLDAVGGLVVAGMIATLFVVAFLRQGRNAALEQTVIQREFRAPIGFMGTLAVEEYKPGVLLRLAKSTEDARNLQWRYRLLGVGRQANFDRVLFDRYAGVVGSRKRARKLRLVSWNTLRFECGRYSPVEAAFPPGRSSWFRALAGERRL